MIFFILILLLLMFGSAKTAAPGRFHSGYLSKDSTLAIKGIFVVLVVFSHCKQYVNFAGKYDQPYLLLQNHLNQMIVALFLFYSGYGLMEQISKKGWEYVKKIPRKRFLCTLINFDLAVICFGIMNTILGQRFDAKRIALSLIGWLNLGNSNWYIFAILVLYLCTFIAFIPMRWIKNKSAALVAGLIILTLLTVGFVWFEIAMDQPMYCYDTAILLPLGAWYSRLKGPIEKVVMSDDAAYLAALGAAVGVYWVSYGVRFTYGVKGFSVWACAFTLLVVLLTMKISIESPVLKWFGQYVFGIYILQRIPMTIMAYFHLNRDRYMFLIMALLISGLLAVLYDKLTGKISGFIMRIPLHKEKKNV